MRPEQVTKDSIEGAGHATNEFTQSVIQKFILEFLDHHLK